MIGGQPFRWKRPFLDQRIARGGDRLRTRLREAAAFRGKRKVGVGAIARGGPLESVGSVPDGHYARKQLRSGSTIIAFSHSARFRTAVALAGSDPSGMVLDYGSGDGTFLGFVAEKFASCVGADAAIDQVEDCGDRFKMVPNVRFCHTSELVAAEHTAAYRLVTCMEVLEHCTDQAIDQILSDICRLVASDGRVIISVPIETGPSFVLKYVVRTIAGWRRLSDYRHYERYSVREAFRMLFASPRTQVDRPLYREHEAEFYSHYGFNWRRLEKRVGESLVIDRRMFSPFNILNGWFSSQAWLICRPR